MYRRLFPYLVLAAACVFPAQRVAAGYFNCSVVYDEFDSLMNNRFLIEPDRYVGTLNGSITRTQFEALQRGQFLVYPERAASGIAIFRTNENLHGKLLYHFSDPLPDGKVQLIIDEAVLLARVSDGYGPIHLGPLRLKPGVGLDLDSGSYVEPAYLGVPGGTGAPDASTADLLFGFTEESAEPFIAAVNEATIQFPVESMCLRPEAAPRQPSPPPVPTAP